MITGVLHEFTHHLLETENPTSRTNHLHGKRFYTALLRVIAASGVRSYDFSDDYPQLRRMAIKDGVHTEELDYMVEHRG
jgi:hypothetical protein